MEDENLAQFFWEKLLETNQPGALLVSFYSRMFDAEFDRTLIPKFNKLIKVYGREIVFHALIIAYGIEEHPDDIFLFLTRLSSKLLESRTTHGNSPDLTKHLQELESSISKPRHKKLEVKNPFND